MRHIVNHLLYCHCNISIIIGLFFVATINLANDILNHNHNQQDCTLPHFNLIGERIVKLISFQPLATSRIFQISTSSTTYFLIALLVCGCIKNNLIAIFSIIDDIVFDLYFGRPFILKQMTIVVLEYYPKLDLYE